MTKEPVNNSNGIGFVGLLQVVFITLKLLNKIEWSWLWVFSPTFISLGISAIVLLICGLIVIFKKEKKK